jgi:hypothetical protein
MEPTRLYMILLQTTGTMRMREYDVSNTNAPHLSRIIDRDILVHVEKLIFAAFSLRFNYGVALRPIPNYRGI